MTLRRLVPLRDGEIVLIRRALRCYLHGEQVALQEATLSGDAAHAADVRRQVTPRLKATGELLDRLLHDPEGKTL